MKVFLGTDHAGFEQKEELKKFLLEKGFEVEDVGAHEYDKDDDYPDFCGRAARGVSINSGAFGFVFGKSGSGEMIVANKIRGVRCTLGISSENVKLSRQHNDCNMLSFGSAFVSSEEMKDLAVLFLETPFSGEARHVRRIQKIKELEESV